MVHRDMYNKFYRNIDFRLDYNDCDHVICLFTQKPEFFSIKTEHNVKSIIDTNGYYFANSNVPLSQIRKDSALPKPAESKRRSQKHKDFHKIHGTYKNVNVKIVNCITFYCDWPISLLLASYCLIFVYVPPACFQQSCS